MIELTDIAYVRTGAADLAGAVDFATRIVGLELVEGGEPGVAHLRADARHHCLALVGGESGVIATGFTVADHPGPGRDRAGAARDRRHPR
jgi:2,3-dihydroxy-p-cumate/2,3-dihydroxybenzoate 3,4-dioxygenase